MASKKSNKSNDPHHFVEVAKRHLDRVEDAQHAPDWADIGTYGLYCLEALVRAAALKSGETPIKTHWGKAEQAANLAAKHNLPEISKLLSTLNIARKANAYGDEEFDESDYDAKDIAKQITEYFDKVEAYIKT